MELEVKGSVCGLFPLSLSALQALPLSVVFCDRPGGPMVVCGGMLKVILVIIKPKPWRSALGSVKRKLGMWFVSAGEKLEEG